MKSTSSGNLNYKLMYLYGVCAKAKTREWASDNGELIAFGEARNKNLIYKLIKMPSFKLFYCSDWGCDKSNSN